MEMDKIQRIALHPEDTVKLTQIAIPSGTQYSIEIFDKEGLMRFHVRLNETQVKKLIKQLNEE